MSDRAGHVAYLTGEYPRATDTWIQREIAALRDQGVTVDSFAVRQPGQEHLVGPEQVAETGRTTYLYPRLRSPRLALAHLGLAARSPGRYLGGLRLAWRTRRPGLSGTAYQAVYFLEAGLLAAAVRRRRIAHLHNHFGDSSCTVAMVAAALGGFTFSFTLHGPGIFFEAHTWRLDEKLRRAAFVACISWFCRSQAAIFAHPDHLDRLHIVHCGIRPELLERRRHEGPGPELLFVGRLAEVKGVAVLLEALVEVSKAHPDVHLTVVGDGPERARFEARTARLGLERHVTFAGYLSQAEVAAQLARTDVFVLPSYAEGVPVTLMEAMGAAVPVVATQVGGVSELVDHGSNGYVVRPGDPAPLADCLTRLIADGELRQRLGDAGRGVVGTEFANDREAARLRLLFQNTLAGLPTPTRPELDQLSRPKA
jgi:colanic acid/amylovoran biosynthesis glycosyltransferase